MKVNVYIRKGVAGMTTEMIGGVEVFVVKPNDEYYDTITLLDSYIIKPPKICITTDALAMFGEKTIVTELHEHLQGNWKSDNPEYNRDNDNGVKEETSVYDNRENDLYIVSHINHETVVCLSHER